MLLIIGALGLTACGSDVAPTEATQPAQATETPAPLPLQSVTLSGGETGQALPTPTDEGEELGATADVESEPPVPPPAPIPEEEQPSVPSPPSVLEHAVQAGETLLEMAMEYSISMAAIQLANGMGDSIDLIAGQTLFIPGNTQWPGENSFWIVHVVQEGETLVELSSAYDMTIDEILRVNAIADPGLIHINQQLVVPLARMMTAEAPQATLTPAAIAAAPANALAAPIPAETSTPTENETPTTPEPPPATIPPPAMPAGPSDWPNYILTRINQARAENGLNALTVATELNLAAQAHAQDCAQRGWGSHVGSDGAVLRTRLERVGYFGSNQGENWVQAQNAERGFEWWYGEIPPYDAHRRNILSPYYTEVGIGIAETGWGFIFVTDFGRR